jgi:hypothetical protein
MPGMFLQPRGEGIVVPAIRVILLMVEDAVELGLLEAEGRGDDALNEPEDLA